MDGPGKTKEKGHDAPPVYSLHNHGEVIGREENSKPRYQKERQWHVIVNCDKRRQKQYRRTHACPIIIIKNQLAKCVYASFTYRIGNRGRKVYGRAPPSRDQRGSRSSSTTHAHGCTHTDTYARRQLRSLRTSKNKRKIRPPPKERNTHTHIHRRGRRREGAAWMGWCRLCGIGGVNRWGP